MTSSLWLALSISTAIDATTLAAVLFRRRGSRIGVVRLIAALFASAACFFVKLPVWIGLAGSMFFAVHLAYWDTFLTVPLVGVAVLIASRRREVTRLVRWSAVATTLLPLVAIYATWIEPFRLVEERVEVRVAREHGPAAPLRIAVLADLQSREVDEHLERAVRSAMAFEPHLILLPGDLIQGSREEIERVAPQFRALLAQLDAPLGVFFVLGNTDDGELVRKALAHSNVRILENEAVELAFEGRTILLGGAGAFPSDPKTRTFTAELEHRPGNDLRLLVAHYPDVVLDLEGPPRIDLTIAGHTHGGQVQIPFFGPPIKLSRVPREVAAGGLRDLNGRALYVSRGVGVERGSAPRVRFLAPPEVTLITVTHSESD